MNIEELEELSEKLSMDDLMKIIKLKSQSERKFSEQFYELISDVFEWADFGELLKWVFDHDRTTYNNVSKDLVEDILPKHSKEYYFFKADSMDKEIAFEKFLESMKQ